MNIKPKKTFDCVEMKRRGAERIRSKIQGMSCEEELTYWNRGTAELLEMQKTLRESIEKSLNANE